MSEVIAPMTSKLSRVVGVSRVVGIIALCAIVLAIGTIQSRAEAVQSQTPTGECQPKRSVLPDGTIEVQNRDCSITRTSKQDVLKGPADDPNTSETAGASPAAKLRGIKPEPLPSGTDDPKLKAKYAEAMNGYFEYYIAGYQHRQRVFQWQLTSSRIIFVIVTLLVFAGIYFAALQFYEGMRQRERALAANAAARRQRVRRRLWSGRRSPLRNLESRSSLRPPKESRSARPCWALLSW